MQPLIHSPEVRWCISYLICVSLTFPHAWSQDLTRIDQYTSEHGLSENVVYCVHQDKQGFIWIGTDYGLNRYDGYNFQQYHKSNTDTTTLSNESILCISEDEVGNFWIGTYYGLNYFNPRTGKAKRFLISEQRPMGVLDIYPLGEGQMLLYSTSAEVYFFDLYENKLHMLDIPAPERLPLYRFLEFPGGLPGIVWRDEAAVHHVAVFDTATLQMRSTTVQDLLPFAREENINFYFRDSRGFQFISSADMPVMRVYDQTGQAIAQMESVLADGGSMQPLCVTETGQDQVWIGTNAGIVRYDRLTNTFSQPTVERQDELRTGECRDILSDKDGNIWAGTFGFGLQRYHMPRSPFRHFTLSEVSHGSMEGLITGLYPWSEKALAIFTFDTKLLIREEKNIRLLARPNVSLATVVNFTANKTQQKLSAFQTDILSGLEDTLSPYPLYGFILPDDTTLIYYHVGFFIHTPHIRKRLVPEFIKNVAQDDAFYWISTGMGLYRIDRKEYTDTVYRFEAGNPSSLSENILYYVYVDTDQDLWIGTKGGGLNYFNRKQNRFSHFTTEDGLPDNVVYFILPDRQGNLWLTTNKGISRFNPEVETFTNFNQRDGLLNSEFNTRGGLAMPDGTFYFAGTNGVDYFKPEEVQSELVRGVYISRWTINEKEVLGSESFDFPYDLNDFEFSFTTNDFIRPDLVYFRYRLRKDNLWTSVQGRNLVSYSDLLPGEYRFEVQASYDHHTWSNSAWQEFEIRTPFWRTWWFLSVCGLSVLTGIYIVYRYRIGQLQRLHRMRTRISQDLHDEVGSALSSIHLFSTVASKSLEENRPAAKEALSNINRSSRKVMEKMSDIVWAINTGDLGVHSLERKLKNYGYELLSPLEINCTYTIDTEAEKRLQDVETRKNVLLIAKEAMNNIAKYSGASEATISLLSRNGSLFLEISDNGRGFDPAKVVYGNGIVNMQRRTEEMRGKFTLNTGEKSGTVIRSAIPSP